MKMIIRSLSQSRLVSIPGIVLGLFLLLPLVSYAASWLYIDSDTGYAGFGNEAPEARIDASGAIYSRLVTATSTTLDWSQGNVQTMSLSSDPTLIFTNGRAGGQYVLILNQDATGGREVTWPTSIFWAGGTQPVLTTDAYAIDTASFIYDGSHYLGTFAADYRGTSCGFGDYIESGECRGYLTVTGTSTWTVPSDWNNSANTIEVIGGGSGSTGGGGTAGGGGAYSAVTNLSLTPNDSIDYSVGVAGTGGISSATGGGDTWFDGATFGTASVAAKGANDGSGGSSNVGGAAASGTGTTKYSGGSGALYCSACNAGGGAGGAAGPHGAGNDGIRQSGQFGPGASADAGSGGAGGSTDGAAGGNGTEWDNEHGSGGGGAGSNIDDGGSGGEYGGGGGGGVYPGPSTGGSGGQGIIVITYTQN